MVVNAVASVLFTGASEASYKYWIYPLGQTFNLRQPGNYIFTRAVVEDGKTVHYPVYIGETAEGLQERFNTHERAACIRMHGATHVLVHVNSDRHTREAEETDLIRRWSPPCNRQ